MLAERWSPRSFEAGTEISTEDLTAVIEAARWAPSANNVQPWSFIIGRNGDVNFTKITDSLTGFNQKWAPQASALIVMVANMQTPEGDPRPISMYDCGLAAAALTIEAIHRGYAVHQMAGFEVEQLNAAFDVVEGCSAIVVLAIGKQAPAEDLADSFARDLELAPRERKPLTELIISGDL